MRLGGSLISFTGILCQDASMEILEFSSKPPGKNTKGITNIIAI